MLLFFLRNVAVFIYALFGEISILEIPVGGKFSLFTGLDDLLPTSCLPCGKEGRNQLPKPVMRGSTQRDSLPTQCVAKSLAH